ncbi:hypothetical protein GCM10007298_37330 [Williamsia phyllosphaerae]|uniref:Uncharacterized protein n=1 Tax=Williamsia phyllosphaerae TaxID=885042 RepID=A0ABQ1V5T6_9NOCA|nr:hypothetical protein GCM10007298_37330 [Williamsia phyllosphaerae]
MGIDGPTGFSDGTGPEICGGEIVRLTPGTATAVMGIAEVAPIPITATRPTRVTSARRPRPDDEDRGDGRAVITRERGSTRR